MKTLTAALCCFLVLGKTQSLMQMMALSILSITPLVFQMNRHSTGKNKTFNSNVNVVKDDKKRTEKSNQPVHLNKKRFLLGICPCLGATLLSGLAGSFSQKSLQLVVGSMERNAFFYSAEISFFTAVSLLISMSIRSAKNGKTNGNATAVNSIDSDNFFVHWSWHTWIPVIVKATAGILTALVHKHAGSVLKGFSLVLGLIFSALLQTLLDGDDLTLGQFSGTALVLLSSWLHFTSPP
eukprot:710174_1